jgi:hypothetical protein
MKRVITIVIVIFVILLLSSIRVDVSSKTQIKVQTEPIEEEAEVVVWDSFVAAVIQVESKGNDNAYCRKEDAVGCLQIRPIMVREVNRILKLNNIQMRYTLNDRWRRVKSLEMFEIMAEEVECCEDLTRLEFYEIVARKWNGGHRGDKKRSTKKYWKKVKEKL